MKYTRRQLMTFMTFAISNFCQAVCVSLQAPFYPAEAEKKGATAAQYGFVFGVFELVVFLASPLYGRYLRQIGPSYMFSAGLFTTGSTCILFGLLDKIQSPEAFISLSFAVRIVEALGNAGFLTSSFSLIAEEFPESVGATFAILETCFGVGLILGPTLGGTLYSVGGYSLPFLVMGSILLLAVFASIFTLPKDNASSENSQSSGNFFKALKAPPILISSFAIAATSASIGFLQATLEPSLRDFKLTPLQTGLMFILNGGAYGIFAPLWGYLCDKFVSPRVISLIGSFLCIIAFLTIGPAPFLPLNHTLPLCIVALIIHGLGFGALVVATFSGMQRDAVARGFPDNIQTYGLISGLWTSIFAFGAFVGPTVAGVLQDQIGFPWGSQSVVITMLMVAMFLISYICLEKKPSEKIKDMEKKPLLQNQTSYISSSDSCYGSQGEFVRSSSEESVPSDWREIPNTPFPSYPWAGSYTLPESLTKRMSAPKVPSSSIDNHLGRSVDDIHDASVQVTASVHHPPSHLGTSYFTHIPPVAYSGAAPFTRPLAQQQTLTRSGSDISISSSGSFP